MIVVFNLQNVGLGNNGGSRTVIKCAETMAKLGVNVYIWTKNNKYTWHQPRGIKISNSCPTADAMIATGFKSVPSTVASKARKKFYYIRGYETWVANEAELIKSFKKLHCIVNSEWLHKRLENKGVYSDIVYPGLDSDVFKNRDESRDLVIGGLFHKKHPTKRHVDIIEIGKKVDLPVRLLNRDFKNPNESQLNNWYNKIPVWVAPTELEGLHNPPMESSLAGCALVCTDHPRGGMSDYAIDKETALVYPARRVNIASEFVLSLMGNDTLRKRLNANMLELLSSKIGSRKTNMQKMIDLMR